MTEIVESSKGVAKASEEYVPANIEKNRQSVTYVVEEQEAAGDEEEQPEWEDSQSEVSEYGEIPDQGPNLENAKGGHVRIWHATSY